MILKIKNGKCQTFMELDSVSKKKQKNFQFEQLREIGFSVKPLCSSISYIILKKWQTMHFYAKIGGLFLQHWNFSEQILLKFFFPR